MSLFTVIAILLTVTALFSYLNHRYFRLPTAIGLMLTALIISIAIMVSDDLGFDIAVQARAILSQINFSEAVLDGMLSFLLLAGALHTNFVHLRKEKWVVGLLATVGVVFSSVLIGVCTYGVLKLVGVELSLLYCFVFGALISPTDPIAVLSILRGTKISKSLETKIAGEALFNDGVGVVAFIVFLTLALDRSHPTMFSVSLMLVRQVIGGVALGLAMGWVTSALMKRVSDAEVEVMLTLGLAAGGYSLALALGTSGPIAIVTAGLVLGSQRRRRRGSDYALGTLEIFWEVVDGILNAVLFVLMGFYLLLLPIEIHELIAGTIIIAVVLAGRFVSVSAILQFFTAHRRQQPRIRRILTWGGVRGGVSIALALSIPAGMPSEIIVSITYLVVAFSILVQGLTFKYLIGD